MSVQNTKTTTDAFQFHAEAVADAKTLDKGNATMAKAVTTNITKYAAVGETIRSLGVTFGDYARAAMFPTREEWNAYRAEQIENGTKDPRPTAQTSFQRAFWIAKRVHADGVDVSELVEQYKADKNIDNDSVTLNGFASWCNGSEPKAPLGALEKFIKACRHAVPELGETECLRVLAEAIDELG
jgi:hypothetical protein